MVIPYVTQMAWLKYPLIFCVASETARDTTENNIDKPVDGFSSTQGVHGSSGETYRGSPGWHIQSVPSLVRGVHGLFYSPSINIYGMWHLQNLFTKGEDPRFDDISCDKLSRIDNHRRLTKVPKGVSLASPSGATPVLRTFLDMTDKDWHIWRHWQSCASPTPHHNS